MSDVGANGRRRLGRMDDQRVTPETRVRSLEDFSS
jgi:hypothetical protein